MFLFKLLFLIKQELLDTQLSDFKVNSIISKLNQHIVDNWGGLSIYIPHKIGNRDARNQQICQEFIGNNHRQLAKKYCLSVTRIYQIIKTNKKNNK